MTYTKYIIIACFMLVSCNNTPNSNPKEEETRNEIDSIAILQQQIAELQLKVEQLSFPADQRLAEIKNLVNNNEYDVALERISELKKLFPNSDEAQSALELVEIIEQKKAEIIAEQKRIKALGFKAIKQTQTLLIDYNKITLSNISIGRTFVFDAHGDEWYYREADRGNKYVTMAMAITSESKNPNIPQFAIYKINGDKLEFEGTFTTRYARWSDYGSYLGNYHDSRNDFSKVSTVQFKLGCEVSETTTKGSFAIVVMNKNILVEQYERFNNPPQYWAGSAHYPKILSLESFEKEYTLIKVYNLK